MQKRVTQLQLHLSVAHSDSENSAASSGRKGSKKRGAEQSKRQGKKQRKEESAGDETQEQFGTFFVLIFVVFVVPMLGIQMKIGRILRGALYRSSFVIFLFLSPSHPTLVFL